MSVTVISHDEATGGHSWEYTGRDRCVCFLCHAEVMSRIDPEQFAMGSFPVAYLIIRTDDGLFRYDPATHRCQKVGG